MLPGALPQILFYLLLPNRTPTASSTSLPPPFYLFSLSIPPHTLTLSDKRKRRKEAKLRNAQQKELGKEINSFKSGNFLAEAKKLVEESKKQGKTLDTAELRDEKARMAAAAVPVSASQMNNMEDNIKIKEVDDDII